ncbi:hypothetical protein Q3V23_20190 [Streptomyces sp. VNUA116]|uniref:hypothetical protein n=1 Tax=Streptomyces sp. VNUA116 TaxID=3062449 RepID=UPI0026751782|nr:hypothetical protein [Streptomyces sp. VNUA116]WKU46194.1 hypothetical protein Q3V23_20190 [Streptomyces sp. VNUA116]
MKDSISRLLARTRALFSRRAALETPVTPLTPPEAPSLPEPLRPHCGVYVWATAHGIDIARSSKLLTCTCSTHPSHPADGEALRAKVREVNARSTWGK